MRKHHYVVSITDPFSDTLVVLGLRHLLAALLEKQGSPTDGIRFVDCGSHIRLELDEPIREETIMALDERNYIMPVPFIQTIKNASSLPPDLVDHVNDYEALKEQNAHFYEAVRAGMKGDDLPGKPIAWDVLRTINPAALPGWTNILADWWKLRPAQSIIMQLILELYSHLPNPVDEAAEHWKALNKEHGWGVSEMATCQQFFNPDQGKGQNRSKADGVSVANIKGFWLVEFLKMVGFYHDAITKTVAGGKDRKIFVIAPRNIRAGDHDTIMSRFKPTITSETSIRFDILAALRYTQTLLDHFYPTENVAAVLLGIPIQQQLVAGFHTAFYLDLGNAVATMNVSSIALPSWVVVHEPSDVQDYRGILDELITFTRQFEEKNSDAFTLLQYLRDFVSGDDLDAFFRLTDAFPVYYIGMRERGKYAQQLTTSTIERIIRMTDRKLFPILETSGFQKVAYAIRHSTVVPQRQKAKGNRLYEIRYGLAQDLTRVARRGKELEFIGVLSEFIQQYNGENARIYEVRKVQYRQNITTEDIDDITRLIDEYGAPTIARMLVAYGYARVPRDEAEAEALAQDENAG